MWELQPYALFACKCGADDRWAILPPGNQLGCMACKTISTDFQVAPATNEAIFRDPSQSSANNVPNENTGANNERHDASGKGKY